MSWLIERPWLRRYALALAAVLGLGAMTSFSSPGNAAAPAGFGTPSAVFAPADPAAHPYAEAQYWRWRGPGWRWRGPGWRWRNWCYYHPYRCGWR